MEKNIKEFVEHLPEKKDSNKIISLYTLIKKECPNTIKHLNKKIYGTTSVFKKEDKEKWYTSFINYLTKKEVLETERSEEGTYHNVTDEYTKYFLVPKSTIYSLDNKKQHLTLYKQQSKEFLEKVGILDKEGNEFIKSESKKIFKFSDKHKKWIKIISIIVLSWTVLQHILMISKYGLDNMISITLNFILFVISLLLIIQE